MNERGEFQQRGAASYPGGVIRRAESFPTPDPADFPACVKQWPR